MAASAVPRTSRRKPLIHLETPIAEAPAVDPGLARRIEHRLGKLSRFAGADVEFTPARLRKPFSQGNWRALPADARLEHLRVTVAQQVEEELTAYRARKAAEAQAEEVAATATAPAPARRPIARFVALCHKCGKEIPVHTPAPRVHYCHKHEPKSLPKRVADDV